MAIFIIIFITYTYIIVIDIHIESFLLKTVKKVLENFDASVYIIVTVRRRLKMKKV